MMGSRKSTLGTIAAIVVLVAIQALVINYLGRNNYLPEGSEHWTEDWLIHYFSPRLDQPYKAVALLRAIRSSKAPVVLAAVNDSYVQTDAQRKFLQDFIQKTGRPAGHIGLKRSKEI